MVKEKMKLKILAAISSDLAKHIDAIFSELSEQKSREYSIDKVIEIYLSVEDKDADLVKSVRSSEEVVKVKREISFIFYLLKCPFYTVYSINEYMTKEDMRQILTALNINKWQFKNYIQSAKHHYRFYKEFRIIIDRNIEYNQKA